MGRTDVTLGDAVQRGGVIKGVTVPRVRVDIDGELIGEFIEHRAGT